MRGYVKADSRRGSGNKREAKRMASGSNDDQKKITKKRERIEGAEGEEEWLSQAMVYQRSRAVH